MQLTRSFVSVLLGLVLCACAAGGGRAIPTNVTEGQPFELGVPDLEGKTLRVSAFKGKVVLVDVWATWCVPCERSFPFYARLQREYADRGFEVVAVSVDERVEDVRQWLASRNLPFVIGHDPDGRVPQRIGLRTMPSAVVLDREGRVAAVHAGFDPVEEPELERMIVAVLDKK